MRRLVALLLCSATVAAVAAPAASAATRCAGAGRSVEQLGTSAARTATLCALNRERARHGLRALRVNARLTKAAQGHSRDMVAHRYFAHESRDGSGFGARIKRTGWTRHRRSWMLGENIGYGSGSSATPAAIVSAWMHSAGHRANILQRRFRSIGIGIASGTPGGDGGATYSTDFGS
jgi:uncharacterized protein YkwD